MAASCNGAYVALVSTQGLLDGHHPTNRSYQVHFLTLKTPEAASALLLQCPAQNLYTMADLLDLLRWQILKDRRIPEALTDDLERRIGETGSAYLWRFKLFLARILRQSLQSPLTEHRWKPSRGDGKVCVGHTQEEGKCTDGGAREGEGLEGQEEEEEEERAKAQALIGSIETHLMREHMKKVLGVVYLNTCITQNTSIPTCGLMEYLSGDATDHDLEVKLAFNFFFFNTKCLHSH